MKKQIEKAYWEGAVTAILVMLTLGFIFTFIAIVEMI